MKRKLSIILSSLLVILIIGSVFITSSENGLNLVISLIKDNVPGTLSIKDIRGRLIGPINMTGLQYSSDELTVELDSLSLDWKPSHLLYLQIYLDNLNASGIHIKAEESKHQSQETRDLPDISLPMDIKVNNLLISDISILQSGSAYPFLIQEVKLTADMDKEALYIDKFSFLTPEFALTLRGKVKPEGNYPLEAQVDWNIRPEGYSEIAGEGTLSGTIHQLKIVQAVNAPFNARLHATVYDVLKDLRWEMNLEMGDLSLRNLKDTWPELGINAHAKSTGSLLSFDIEGKMDVSEKQYGKILGDFVIAKEKDKWLAKTIKLSFPGTEAGAEFSGSYSKVDDITSFQSQGNWKSLSWPLNGKEPVVSSREGTFEINGTPDMYGFSLTADVSGTNIPWSDIRLSGTGTQDGIILSSLSAKLLDGELTADGAVAWSPSLNWNASIQTQKLNPGALWPDWPGSLNIKSEAKGRMQNSKLHISIDNTSIQGELRGYPFNAAVVFELSDTVYRVPKCELTLGSAHLSASGSYSNMWDAQWNVRIPDLGEIFPGGKGEMHGEGKISKESSIPKFTAYIKGSQITINSYQAADLEVNMNIDPNDIDNSNIDVSAEDVFVNTQEINKFKLTASGNILSHTLELSAETPLESISLSASAGYKNDLWDGSLKQGKLDMKNSGIWNLKEPTTFFVSSKAVRVGNHCWINDAASACFQTAWTEKDGLSSNSNLSNIPLSTFGAIIHSDIVLDGTLDGDADISFNNNKLYGHVTLKVPTGAVSYPLKKGESVTLPLGLTRLDINLNEDAFDMTVDLSLHERGFIKGNIKLPQFSPLEFKKDQQMISGRIFTELKSLDLIPLFIPAIENTDGIIITDLNLSGSIGNPEITGNISLQEGNAAIPGLGINLQDMYFDIKAYKSGSVNINGRFSSGSGTANIKGNASLKNLSRINGELHVKGENVEAVKKPELWVVVSPDLTIKVQGRSINVDGSILIPDALIESPELSDAVPLSKNVFIISESTRKNTGDTLLINSRIKLVLGDNVRVDGFGLTGRIAGGINITEEPGKPTTAQGELMVKEGQYKAYGQKLEIEKGRLIFLGLLDDPGLDFKAVRHIKEVISGVQVNGTLKNPELRVFSVPSMEQSEALSYLLFGRPMNRLSSSEGGQLNKAASSARLSGIGILSKKIGAVFGVEDVDVEEGETVEESALVIGKYLSPKLYVSYGVGLFEPINTMRIRYNLSPKWTIQTERGIESGGDLLYTIEK